MGYLESRLGRRLGALVAASLLAGVSAEAGAYGSKGRLELTTGKTISSFGFEYQTKNGSDSYEPPTVRASQTFGTGKGCTIFLNPVSSSETRPMVTLTASGGRNQLGYVSTSIGVFDGPQGAPCGRLSKDKDETLALEIDSYLEEVYFANAFDRLELDIEVKGDVKLRVDVYFNGTKTNDYFLLAGAAQVAGAPDPEGKELNPLDDTYKCSASSDSGPDAGPGDNCRLIINDIGDKFVLVPVTGEVSLEGGGDFDLLPRTRTHIYLTEADGILDCGDPTPPATSGDLTCNATRESAGTETCYPVPYVFRAEGNQCRLSVDAGDQQFVANIFATFKSESQKTAGVALNNLTAWIPADLSKIQFDTIIAPQLVPPCLGLTIDGEDYADLVGPLAFPEVLDSPGTYDRTPGDGNVEFACSFVRQEAYGTEYVVVEGVTVPKPTVTVTEGIQFWGDPLITR